MAWSVFLHPDFEPEFAVLPDAVRIELLKRLQVVAEFGPDLGRPNVDTLNDSDYKNMKELRFRLNGLWRFAFAFDPKKAAIFLIGGNKEGANQKLFYKNLIRDADARFKAHLKTITAQEKKDKGHAKP